MGIINRITEIVRTIRFSASPRLYGRSSSGAGNGEEISIGSGLTLTGGVLAATGVPASHTHVSVSITDASTYPPYDEENDTFLPVLVKFDEDGSISPESIKTNSLTIGNAESGEGQSTVSSNLYFLLRWESANGLSSFSFGTNEFAGVDGRNVSVLLPNRSGRMELSPIGPYANDAAASAASVAIGSLYYTADGSVKRRMA